MSNKRDRRAYWVKVEDLRLNLTEGSENIRKDFGSFPFDLAVTVVEDELTEEDIEEIREALEGSDSDDPLSLLTLVKDIRLNGVRNALKGYSEDDLYIVVVGNRRTVACHILQKIYGHDIEEVPFEILPKSQLNPEEILLMQYTENSTQKPYSDIESAKIFDRLLEMGYSESDLAERTGKSIAFIRRILPLASLYGTAEALVREGSVSTQAAITAVRTASEVESNPVKATKLASDKIVEETKKAKEKGRKKPTASEIEDSIRSSKNDDQIDYALEGLRELPNVNWDSLPEKIVAQVWRKVSKVLDD